MKISYFSLVFIFISLSFVKDTKIQVHDLLLSWSEVIRCNCTFAKDKEHYWSKKLFFARDSVGRYGLIQLTENNSKNPNIETKIPIEKLVSKTRKKGEKWNESYVNDSIRITLNSNPIPKQIMNTYSYDVDFKMVYKGDTLKKKLIGHCSF